MKLSDIKPGDTVMVDAGFPCMKPGPYIVRQDERGTYVRCRAGHHYIDGQEDNDGNLIGIQPYTSSPAPSTQITIEVTQTVLGTNLIRRVRKQIDLALLRRAKHSGDLLKILIDECLAQINDQPPQD